jgi:polygalacturonase
MKRLRWRAAAPACLRAFIAVVVSSALCKAILAETLGSPSAADIVEAIQSPQIPTREYRFEYCVGTRSLQGDALPPLQATIDRCSRSGGGRVVVPAGSYPLHGPLRLRSHVDLHLSEGATLQFSAHPADFLPVVYTRWEGTELFNYSPFIYASGCTDIAITGTGTIDGNSEETFAKWRVRQKKDQTLLRMMGETSVPLERRVFGEGHWLRPSFIQFLNCTRVRLEGVRIIDSPFWIIHPVYSRHITIRSVQIDSNRLNNDGVDIDSSSHVLVENCQFRTGDDAISIKSGRDAEGRKIGRPSANIVVRNNRFMGAHNGITIGSEISGSVRNVVIENGEFQTARHLLYIKSNLDRGGTVENIRVQGVVADEVTECLIRIDTNYSGYRGGGFPTEYRNIDIRDVRCRKAKRGIHVDRHPTTPFSNVRISDVTIKREETPSLVDAADGVVVTNVSINGSTFGFSAKENDGKEATPKAALSRFSESNRTAR